MEWLRSGVPYPKEVITDFSRALLTVVVRCFTIYKTIEEYADACKDKSLLHCYIRIDVAHFIKLYVIFLKSLSKRIKVFYLTTIGQLIKCSDITKAREIIKDLLTVAQSETEGALPSGEMTQCEKAKVRLKELIIGM